MPKTTDTGAPDGAPTADASGRCAETPRRNPSIKALSSGALIGYARVSTTEQVLDRQTDALAEAGCGKIFTDKASSVVHRPELESALAYLRRGDTLVIHALDRLGRKTTELLAFVEDLHAREVNLRILTLGVDTRTPAGQLVMTVMAAVAQLERDLLRERTAGGLAAARARGRVGGRPRVMTDQQVEFARELSGGGKSTREISRLMGVAETTVRRRLTQSVAS